MQVKLWAALASVAWVVAAVPAFAAQPSHPERVLNELNTDADHTLSWREVRPAAEARFKALNIDPQRDRTLDRAEAARADIDRWTFDRANPDRDGTLSQPEYLGLVKSRFRAADRDHDGTLSRAELNSSQGRRLLGILERSAQRE